MLFEHSQKGADSHVALLRRFCWIINAAERQIFNPAFKSMLVAELQILSLKFIYRKIGFHFSIYPILILSIYIKVYNTVFQQVSAKYAARY